LFREEELLRRGHPRHHPGEDLEQEPSVTRPESEMKVMLKNFLSSYLQEISQIIGKEEIFSHNFSDLFLASNLFHCFYPHEVMPFS
jgi:hypothetical protein